jgi:hypothetical protein
MAYFMVKDSIAMLTELAMKVTMLMIKGQVEESFALVEVNGREIAIAAILLMTYYTVEETIAVLTEIAMKATM